MTFDKAQFNLGKGSRDYRQYDHVRKSIFGGIAICSLCGYSLCSSGTVYKGEREKYWFLSCNHKSKRFENPCQGVNIKYSDLLELVRQDLNSLINLTDAEIDALVNGVLEEMNDASADDYACTFSLSALMEKGSKNQLDGTVAAGKKFSGVVGYEVPTDWQELEINFTPDVWSGKDITFIATNG